MRQYIVKSYEEEIGTEYFIVKVPNRISEKEAFKVLEMAAKYATMDTYLDEDEGIKEYDIYYAEMVEVREGGNGQDAFNYYLELHEYEVEPLTYNFEYEW